ncbi:MAG: shikimate kinase, partial [Actinomycetia bacterium]|nr:shikimate kinase [Actinomycetes bacterium]
MTEQLKQNQSQLSQTSTSALPSNPTRRTNLVLIGLPGSGKSVLGRQLAKVLKWEFIDIDERIVQAAGQSIPGIFAKLGEAGFRELETRQTELAAQTSAAVIATGGGVVTRPENMAALAATGLVVFIDRRPEDIVQDVRIADRP